MIWRLAEPERITTFKLRKHPSSHALQISIHQPKIQLNRVNQESRRETAGDYIHLRTSEYEMLALDIFLNPHRDTMYFLLDSIWRHWSLSAYFAYGFLKKGNIPFKRFAIEGSVLSSSNPAYYLKHIWSPHIEELSFVSEKVETATTTQVFSPGSPVKIYGRQYGREIENAIRELQSTHSSPSKVPVVKIMKLCEKDLV